MHGTSIGWLRPVGILALALTAEVLTHGTAVAEQMIYYPTSYPVIAQQDYRAWQSGFMQQVGPLTTAAKPGPAGPHYPEGWSGGVEAVFVKPYFEDGVAFRPNQDAPRYDFSFSPRFWLDYQVTGGLGVRMRYWTFNDSTDVHVDPLTFGREQHSILAHVLDLETTQFVSLGGFEFTAAAGLRYARFNVDNIDQNDVNFPVRNTDFEGLGPTVALDVRRPIIDGLSLIVNGRGAMLFGNTHTLRSGGALPTEAFARRDDVVFAVESQTGLEYSFPLPGGRRLALQALMEAQIWSGGFEQPAESSEETDDVGGFFGGTVGLIYSW